MEKQSFLWFLEKEEIGNIFSVAKLEEVQAMTDSHIHDRKARMCLQKSYKNKAVFLKKGKLEIIKVAEIEGKQKQWTMGIIYTGAIWSFSDFNKENGPQSQTEFSYIVKVLEDSEFLQLDNLKGLFIHESVPLSYLKIFAIQRNRMEKRVENYVYKDARTRVIDYILCLLKKRGQPRGSLIVLKPFMTHKEVSKLTSTTRQIVTTVLNNLRNKQILTFDRNILIIKNRKSLEDEIKIKKNRLLEIQK